jgi:GNAT superfamily N-acetyltransferase
MSKKIELQPVNLDELVIKPLTRDTWQAFEALFGENGACGGCWCMYWHLKRSDFYAQHGDATHEMMQQRVEQGEIPGLLAFAGEKAIGWVAIEPRSAYQVLARSRTLTPVDELPVWSITCFFIDRHYRKQGLNAWLIKQAVDYAFTQGAPAVESYPSLLQGGKTSNTFYYTGKTTTFEKLGFKEVARPSKSRAIMRFFKLEECHVLER